MSFRVGFGIDFHQLVAGRELWLGGIKLPHEKGALGHSDADVLLHSICDALLGAACLGDIGVHFPDTSDEFKNIAGHNINSPGSYCYTPANSMGQLCTAKLR